MTKMRMMHVVANAMKKGPKSARVPERVEAEIERFTDEERYEIWMMFATNELGIRDLAEKKKATPAAISEIIRDGYEAWGNQLHEVGYKAGVRSMTPPRWPGGAKRAA